MDNPTMAAIVAEIETFCRERKDGSITIHVTRGCPRKLDIRAVKPLSREAA